MATPHVITLLTDFGTTDAYVGIVKGILLARAPEARVVDLKARGILPKMRRVRTAPFLTCAIGMILSVSSAACNSSSEPPAAAVAPGPARDAGANGPATVTGTAAPAAIVTIEGVDGPPAPLPVGPAVMDQYGKQFVPDLMFVRVGQVVEFRNSEDENHNVQVLRRPTGTTVMNESGSKGQVFRHVFEQAGSFDVNCDVHPGMRATIIATDTPFAATAGPDGNFSITNVPPGKYLLKSRTTDGRESSQEVVVTAPQTTVSTR